jgi:hypothetical protein
MIDGLYLKLKDLDIRVFTLSSGKALIGEVVHEYEEGIQLNCPLEIRKVILQSGEYSEIMLPMLAGNTTENCIVYDRSIETESDTSDVIKRKYAEALVYQRLMQLMSESSEESEDLSYPSPNIDPPDSLVSDTDLWNIFLDRWKVV